VSTASQSTGSLASGSTKSPHWPALDGVRGIAVIAVVLFHLPLPWSREGYAGVDVFFALSGFLITSLLLRERSVSASIDLRAFYARRALRLVPALVVLVAGVVGIALVSGHLASVLPGAIATLLYLSNWWNFSSGHDMPLLEHTWTLSIEEHFYLVWPIILIGLASARRWARWLALTGILVICAVMVTEWPESWDGVRQSYLRSVPIVFGCAVAVLARQPAVAHRLRTAASLLALPVLGILVALLLTSSVPEGLPMSGPASVPGLLTALLVLLLVSAPSTPASRLLSLAALTWAGRRAYGIYLFHFPMISLAMHQVDFGLPVLTRTVIGAIVGVGIAALSYRWIEMPFLRLKKRWVRVPAITSPDRVP